MMLGLLEWMNSTFTFDNVKNSCDGEIIYYNCEVKDFTAHPKGALVIEFEHFSSWFLNFLLWSTLVLKFGNLFLFGP